jgi:hypothetical protein
VRNTHPRPLVGEHRVNQRKVPDHFVANFYFGIDLPFKKINLQFNVENSTNRVFQIGKESEFTPVQSSPPRFISGSVKDSFLTQVLIG